MVNKVLSSVRDLLPKIAARAQKVDDSRKISERTIRELSEAGVFSMLAPKRYGGAESDPVQSTKWSGPSRLLAARPVGSRRWWGCTRGILHFSTTERRPTCGERIRRRSFRPPMRRSVD